MLIHRKVLQREGYRLALLRNPHRTVVVARPTGISVQRIEVAIGGISIDGDALHQVLVRLQSLVSLMGQRDGSRLIVGEKVFVGDAKLVG